MRIEPDKVRKSPEILPERSFTSFIQQAFIEDLCVLSTPGTWYYSPLPCTLRLATSSPILAMSLRKVATATVHFTAEDFEA